MEQYFWIAMHKGTGEIAEQNKPFDSIVAALRAGRKFVEETWSVSPGEASVEVYTEPYHYSEKLKTAPVASKSLSIPGKMEHNPRGGTTVYVQELPKCDFCDRPALYDGKTRMGPWANMCKAHFISHGIGVGTGVGQKLIPRKVLGEAEKIRAPAVEEQTVTMTEEDLEAATMEDMWYPVCPYCSAETPAEPDATAVYCQACNRGFKIENPFF